MRKIIVVSALIIVAVVATTFYWPKEAEADGFRSVQATPFMLEKVKADEWLLMI